MSEYGRLAPERITPTGRRLLSKEPEDHPNAFRVPCYLTRPHAPHPYGAIHPDGGLAKWCRGRDTPAPEPRPRGKRKPPAEVPLPHDRWPWPFKPTGGLGPS